MQRNRQENGEHETRRGGVSRINFAEGESEHVERRKIESRIGSPRERLDQNSSRFSSINEAARIKVTRPDNSSKYFSIQMKEVGGDRKLEKTGERA